MSDGFDDPLFEAALDRLNLADSLPTLRRAAVFSRSTLTEASKALRAKVKTRQAPDTDVIVLGSYARREASVKSDFDYLIVSHRVPAPNEIHQTRELMREMDRFIDKVELDVDQPTSDEDADAPPTSRRPGATGLFGRIVGAPELTERIGLEQDTNASHTRRMLILQESRSIYNELLHTKLVEAILARYLVDHDRLPLEPRTSPPHFLLNDVTRHWFTMTVDYQAKRWESDDKWGLRILKLVGSRKLSYAGTVAALLRCGPDVPMSLDDMVDEFNRQPLARLARLALDDNFNKRPALGAVLRFAEQFHEAISTPAVRDAAAKVRSIAEMQANPELRALRTDARKMHHRLVSIFFDSNLGPRARRYLTL